MKKIISIYVQKNPILIGVVSVATTILLGAVIVFVVGVGIPRVAHAQLGPPCCTLPPPPLPLPLPPPPPPPPPPIIILPPPVSPTCTLSANATSFSYGGGNSTLSWTTSHTSSASINNGVGSVSVSGGSKQIHVSTTGTYVLGVAGAGGKATCDTKIIVAPKPPTPPAPTCTLSSSPSSIQKGGSSKLTYITTHATSFTINHGVGALTPVTGGSTHVSPTQTTAYSGTASGAGGTVTCNTKVTITTPPPPTVPSPVCTLYTSPTNINANGSAVLTWTTKNATSASIDKGIGSVNTRGSKSVSPTETTVYKLTANGAGGKKITCGAKVTVISPTPPPPPHYTAPTCTLSASPKTISGGSSTLSWSTTHASSFSIDGGVGIVAPVISGTTTVTPTNTITYTGTATGAGGTAVCSAVVTVTHGGGGGGGGPMCVLIIASKTIQSGATTTLSWNGSGIKNIFIDNGIGTTTSTSGSVPISPSAGTHVYSGTFTAFSGQKLKCSSTLTVTGVSKKTFPKITLAYFRKPPPAHPLSLVYLSQIPSTGLYLGTVGTIIYWLLLVVWSVALAYVLLFVVIPFIRRKAKVFGARVSSVLNESQIQQSEPSYPPIPSQTNAPKPSYDEYNNECQPAYSSYDGFKSFAQSDALSVEDIVHGLSRSTKQEHDVKSGIINESTIQPEQPITQEISATLSNISATQTMARSKDTQNKISAESPQPVIIQDEKQQLAQANEFNTSEVASTRGFISSLLEGDRTAVFYALRQIAIGDGNIIRFLTDATCMLDDAFRARIDGTDCDPGIIRLTAKYPTPVLEQIISALTTAIDSSYSSDVTASKLALSRALSKIGA